VRNACIFFTVDNKFKINKEKPSTNRIFNVNYF
jgi:hypothetical protein